jgi:hypothetical protein
MWRVLGLLLVLTSCSASGGAIDGRDSSPAREVIRIPLTLYIVVEEGARTSGISSRRTGDGVETVADDISPIWAQADVVFDPLRILTVEMPSEVVQEIVDSGGVDQFFSQAGRTFEVPDIGVLNGFYVREAFEYNGFTPNGSLVFFVADEPSVHDERVSSHEIGHIMGLTHVLDDPSRLMFSGTNGMILTEDEQLRARAAALEILDGTQ